MSASFTTRRTVLAAAGTASLAASLAACGDSGGDGGEGGSSPGAGEKTGGQQEESPQEPEEGGGSALAKTSDVPEGGGKILESEKIVVTQPAAGQFKAFSAVCTHQGCLVRSVSDGTINCPCHGSKYAVKDGSVVQGPATKGLPEVTVSVEKGGIHRA